MDFSNATILCLGDIMLDRFAYCDTERISPEAPVPVLLLKRTQSMLGGVGNTLGYLATGWWFIASTGEKATHWPLFWGGLAISVAVVLIFFAFTYKGRGSTTGGQSTSPLVCAECTRSENFQPPDRTKTRQEGSRIDSATPAARLQRPQRLE